MSRVRVFFEQRLVGMVDVDKNGPGFTYDRDWISLKGAFPVSTTMPLTAKRVGPDTFSPGQQTCCRRMSSCGRSGSFSGWHGRM
jgi:hypothetical protein